MRRWPRLLAVLWGCLAACTAPDAEPPTTPSSKLPAPQNEAPVSPAEPPAATPQPAEDVSAQRIEAWSLACDGASLAKVDDASLAAARAQDEHPSALLLAQWESARAFDASGALEPAAVDALVKALGEQLGSAAPAWWAEQLRSGVRRDGQEPPFYDGKLGNGTDRRGAWRTEHGVRLRDPSPSPLQVHEDRKLTYDFSMGRATLAAAVDEGHMVEYDRPHAGSTVYSASFEPGAGGFPFPLVATTAGGDQRWSATVCGPKRSVLGGVGHLLAQVQVLQEPPAGNARTMAPAPPVRGVAVFTAESHGVAVEVFDPADGKRTLAWSSDLWFARETPAAPSP